MFESVTFASGSFSSALICESEKSGQGYTASDDADRDSRLDQTNAHNKMSGWAMFARQVA